MIKVMILELNDEEAMMIQSENSIFSSCIKDFEKDQIVQLDDMEMDATIVPLTEKV